MQVGHANHDPQEASPLIFFFVLLQSHAHLRHTLLASRYERRSIHMSKSVVDDSLPLFANTYDEGGILRSRSTATRYMRLSSRARSSLVQLGDPIIRGTGIPVLDNLSAYRRGRVRVLLWF